MINGDGQGPIGTASVLSEVSPAHAPAGRALVAVSLADQSTSDSPELLAAVRRQLRDWFGRQAEDWWHLRTDCIDRALPRSQSSRCRTELAGLASALVSITAATIVRRGR